MGVAASRLEVVYTAQAIAAAVERLAVDIRRDLAGARAFAVPVMNGALYFAADLLRAFGPEGVVEGFGSACVASYGDATGPQSPPRVSTFPAAERVAGRTVLVVDTVLDTGATVEAVAREARARGARDVRVVCLIDKPARRRCPVEPDWRGFVGPDRFLVGYGLDAGGVHRTLPYVAALEPDGERA